MVPTKSSKQYCCECCNYNTTRISQYNRHISTDKHKILQNPTLYSSTVFSCKCGKQYKHSSSLYAHKKVCVMLKEITDNDIIKSLMLTNEKLLKVIETGVTSNVINKSNVVNNINSNNKIFNLQVFLNETCKDAMNINDFVSSIQLELKDLEHTGREGFVEGMSNILLTHLSELDQHLRPIHCTDLKREVLYIKDNNEWKKETEGKPILTKAIKVVANENIKQIKTWKDTHPNCSSSESKFNNLYLHIVSNSMNGSTDEEDQKNISKIISNVSKKVIIDKQLI